MTHFSKWLLLALVVAEVILVRAGILDTVSAIGIIVGIEFLLLIVAGRQVFFAFRRFHRDRTLGLDVWAALEDGFAELLPRQVARVLALELRLWSCLWNWLLRRHRLGENEYSYHKRSIMGTMLILVVFSTPAEVILFEIFVPWDWLRWVLLVVCIYALFWIFGLYASMVTLPHRLESNGIRLHYGMLAGGVIPYENIVSCEENRHTAPKGRDGLCFTRSKGEAYLSVGGKTDITLQLTTPLSLHGFFKPSEAVKTIHVAVDSPREFVRQIQLMIER